MPGTGPPGAAGAGRVLLGTHSSVLGHRKTLLAACVFWDLALKALREQEADQDRLVHLHLSPASVCHLSSACCSPLSAAAHQEMAQLLSLQWTGLGSFPQESMGQKSPGGQD